MQIQGDICTYGCDIKQNILFLFPIQEICGMIGIFDSGIGGITLLKEIMGLIPKEDYMYYADTDHVPYSLQRPEDIKVYVEEAVLYLHKKGCTVIVLACNTATNVAVEYLREKYDFPIIAIQPAVKVAADHKSDDGEILVCATPVTLISNRFNVLLDKLGVANHVQKLPLVELVFFAEMEIFSGSEVEAYLKEKIEPLLSSKSEFVVLGCTHFTFFYSTFKKLFPQLKIVDGNYGTAKHLLYQMKKHHLLTQTGNGHVSWINSGRMVTETTRFERYLAFGE